MGGACDTDQCELVLYLPMKKVGSMFLQTSHFRHIYFYRTKPHRVQYPGFLYRLIHPFAWQLNFCLVDNLFIQVEASHNRNNGQRTFAAQINFCTRLMVQDSRRDPYLRDPENRC